MRADQAAVTNRTAQSTVAAQAVSAGDVSMINDLIDLPIGCLVCTLRDNRFASPRKSKEYRKQFATEAEALQDQAELRQAGGWISVTVTSVHPDKKARNTAFQERRLPRRLEAKVMSAASRLLPEILAFAPRRSNIQQGFAEVRLPSGMIMRDIGIYIDGARAWASPPSKPMLDKNGVALRDDRGKIKYPT
jgi:hypothetical protein